MFIRSSVGAWACGLVLAAAVSLGGVPLSAQEPPADTAKPPVAAKKSVDPSRRVPPFFGQVGLTAEQKEEIYKVRARHQAKIDALHKEIVRAQAEMLGECEAVLNESQKQLLNLRRDAAARERKARAASPVASKPSESPVN